MVFQERLLQRIRNQGSRDSGTQAQEMHAIVEHLQRLLNTRQGSVPILPDYGIPDFTNLSGDSFGETAAGMQQAIRRVLEKYEPRLAQVQIRFDAKAEDRSRLRFRIEGVLARDASVPFTLDTTVSSEGRVSVDS